MDDGSFQRSLKLLAADVKNTSGDDQITVTIMKAFEIYIYEIT